MSRADPDLRRVAEILEDIQTEALPNLEVAMIGGLNELAEDLQRLEQNQQDIASALAAVGGGDGGGGISRPGPILETEVEEDSGLENGDTMRLRLDGVDVEHADFVGFLVDDGDNNDPDSYDFVIDHWNSEDDDWMQWVSKTTVTTRAHGDSEVPERVRFSLTKNSAGTATFRIFGFAKVSL